MFSGTSAEFGRPEHSASFMSMRPSFKSAYHLLTIVGDGEKYGYTYQAIVLLEECLVLRPMLINKDETLVQNWTQSSLCYHNSQLTITMHDNYRASS
ncbi:hypothetical protein TNCV_5123081 [Trichonephila clavipes]|nr:hypothetical protein TNCV_5123081 [Trichonephila clavipes]